METPVKKPLVKCVCGRNMRPHHRQIHPGCVWMVCESLGCDATTMVPEIKE